MTISFFLVSIGSLKSFCNFEEIYIDKQPIEMYIFKKKIL